MAVPHGERSVTAVIPARDEAECIARAVRGLRGQKFNGGLSIIVADDESSDRTAEIARESGAQVVRVSPRPAGWKGKLWAVASGIREAEGQPSPDFFLLTDADIEFASGEALASLIAKAEEGFDLVSVMVRLRAEAPAEKFLVPAFVFFFFKLYPPAWVAGRGKTAAAAGGCMLVRRAILEKIDGIESIRGALIDDCALARRVKDAGGRVWLGTTAMEIRSIRAYNRAEEIGAMISRSAFAQLDHSALLLAGTVAGMLLTYVMPVEAVLFGNGIAMAAGGAAWLMSAWMFMPTVRDYRAPVWTCFCLPGIALFYLGATIRSALNYWSGRGGEWKGRVQDTQEL